MTASRRRPRVDRDPDRRPTPPAPPPAPTYQPVPGVGGVVACSKCAGLLVDADGPRTAHAAHHAALALLWHHHNGSG